MQPRSLRFAAQTIKKYDMDLFISTENSLLIGALLLFVAVLAGKAAYRFGAPALLFFLGVGMLFGIDFISFNSVEMTQFIGMIALCIILFTGGMDTKYAEIRPVLGPGVVLATLGVAMTALILAGFVALIAPWLGFEFSFAGALLLAATMSSTDSASVFSILRSKKQGLRENLRPLLELESGSNDPKLESGSNDPMAYILTILLIGIMTEGGEAVSIPLSIFSFLTQMIVGGISGFLLGRLCVWTINRINLTNNSLYPVLLLAFVFFTFSFTDRAGQRLSGRLYRRSGGRQPQTGAETVADGLLRRFYLAGADRHVPDPGSAGQPR